MESFFDGISVTQNFKSYVLECLAKYKALDNGSWKNEFEDVHTIEFYSKLFILNRMVDLKSIKGDKFKYLENMTNWQKETFSKLMLEMIIIMITSDDADNLYLVQRMSVFGIEGYPIFTESKEEAQQITDEIENLFENHKNIINHKTDLNFMFKKWENQI